LVDTRLPRRHITALHFFPNLEEISLANSASARKRARQSEKRRRQNASQRSWCGRPSALKHIASGKCRSQAALTAAIPVIDGMVTKESSTAARLATRPDERASQSSGGLGRQQHQVVLMHQLGLPHVAQGPSMSRVEQPRIFWVSSLE
jgi:small subunit ribosomal protein S20